MLTVLFVCTGNTCRSPMAEAYFNTLVKKEHLDDKFHAVSAGVRAPLGYPASEGMQHVSRKRANLDLSKHQSQPVTAELVKNAFLILAMTEDQKEVLLIKYPSANGKIYTIKEYVNQKGDIPDPVGLPDEAYEDVFDEIALDVFEVLKKLTQRE